jgi:hypothetical protein
MLTIIPLLNSVPNIAFAFQHRLLSASVSPPVVASTDRPVGHGWPRLPRGHPFAPRRRQSGQSRFGNPRLTLVLRTRAFDRQKTHQPPATQLNKRQNGLNAELSRTKRYCRPSFSSIVWRALGIERRTTTLYRPCLSYHFLSWCIPR